MHPVRPRLWLWYSCQTSPRSRVGAYRSRGRQAHQCVQRCRYRPSYTARTLLNLNRRVISRSQSGRQACAESSALLRPLHWWRTFPMLLAAGRLAAVFILSSASLAGRSSVPCCSTIFRTSEIFGAHLLPLATFPGCIWHLTDFKLFCLITVRRPPVTQPTAKTNVISLDLSPHQPCCSHCAPPQPWPNQPRIGTQSCSSMSR